MDRPVSPERVIKVFSFKLSHNTTPCLWKFRTSQLEQKVSAINRKPEQSFVCHPGTWVEITQFSFSIQGISASELWFENMCCTFIDVHYVHYFAWVCLLGFRVSLSLSQCSTKLLQ